MELRPEADISFPKSSKFPEAHAFSPTMQEK